MNDPRRQAPDEPRDGDARWLDAARQALDDGADALDAASLSRLNRARQAALEAARARRAPRWLAPAFAAGACAALAIAAALPLIRGGTGDAPPVAEAGADFEMLAGAEDLALYEDLEFYAWLDSQQPSEG
jgi:hypothetical protein